MEGIITGSKLVHRKASELLQGVTEVKNLVDGCGKQELGMGGEHIQKMTIGGKNYRIGVTVR